MKNTFCYLENINCKEFDEIIQKMKSDLSVNDYSQDDAKKYIEHFLKNAKASSRLNPDKFFFGFANPEGMPSDSRFYYFYIPTYYAAALMIKFVVKYPDLLNEISDFKNILYKVLLGCTCRKFSGKNYEEIKGMLETANIFIDGNVYEFLSEHHYFCEPFSDEFLKTMKFIAEKVLTGEIGDGFGVKNTYEEEAQETLKKFDPIWNE